MKTRAFLALPILLAACTPAMEITQAPVNVGVFSTVSPERVANRTKMTVRTYAQQNGSAVEVGAMNCVARSDELTAEFQSPAELMIPRFVQSGRFDSRGRPSPLLVRCEGGGMSGANSITAQDKELATATNAGIAGAILTTVVSAAMASTTPWQFPPATQVNVQ